MTKNALVEKPIEYLTSTGDKIKLTINMVRLYMVSGKPELATDKEIIFFMKLCQARQLNPFLRECYLIKYDSSPAAIITARSTFQDNARTAPDCEGWTFGVIVQNEKSKGIRYSKGLVLDYEKVVGGWFKATPKGWKDPFELEVNLSQYIKKKSDGNPTQFWTKEKQAGMIAKVAEVQGLRTLWGKKTKGMYSADEIPALDPSDLPDPPEADLEGDPDDDDIVDAEFDRSAEFDMQVGVISGDPEYQAYYDAVKSQVAPDEGDATFKAMVLSDGIGNFIDGLDRFKKSVKAKKANETKASPKKAAEKKSTKKKADPKDKPLTMDNEAWIGIQSYKEHFAELYAEASGGKDPETIGEAEELLEVLKTASKDMPVNEPPES